MNPPCVYHPALAAVGPCSECGAPVCKHCANVVGDQYACPKCAESVRARLGVAAAAPAAGAYPPLQGYHGQPTTPPQQPAGRQAHQQANYSQVNPYPQQSQPVYGDPDAYAQQVHYASGDVQAAPDIPLDATEKRRLTLAIGVSLAVAVVCSIVIMSIVHATGPDAGGIGPMGGFSMMYVMTGVGVGIAFCKIADVGGEDLIAAFATGIMLVGWIVGALYYVCLNVAHSASLGAAFASLGEVPTFNWLLVLVCLAVCWGTAKYQQ